MKCTECREGTLRREIVSSHDIGGLLGLPAVVLVGAPLLKCPNCGAVHVPGPLLDTIIPDLASEVVQVPELTAHEARFLRKMIGLTQTELAERLELSRATIARWETDDGVLGGAHSLALRAIVAMQLIQSHPALATKMAPNFTAADKHADAARHRYQLRAPTEELRA